MRLRTASLGLPWNMPQSIRTFAADVSSRNCDPVTVVAPPRKWSFIRRIVPRGVPRVHPAARLRRIIGRTIWGWSDNAMASYSFVTEWRLGAPIERVYDTIADATAWPSWWPGVVSVDEIRPPADRVGRGRVLRYTFKGKLPYSLS